ncbi:hypothetical protein BWI17_00930 [Betaproteobacteria bacterium GR16-43]|nr:hypothetical protein BWI17_00930 [Betaproteobacteria bacterium GR16-43]
MNNIDTWYEKLALAFLVLTFIAYFVRRALLPRPLEPREFVDVGTVGGCSVEALTDARGRRFVAVGMQFSEQYVRAWITPSQARRLAGLLRTASTPGRNLAQARFNARRGKA